MLYPLTYYKIIKFVSPPKKKSFSFILENQIQNEKKKPWLNLLHIIINDIIKKDEKRRENK